MGEQEPNQLGILEGVRSDLKEMGIEGDELQQVMKRVEDLEDGGSLEGETGEHKYTITRDGEGYNVKGEASDTEQMAA